MPMPELAQEKIDEIARGIFDGTVFTNAHLADPDSAVLQSLVFVGLTFEDGQSIAAKKGHTLLYQDMEKSIGPTHEIDGRQYPTFMTFNTCTREDHSRVIDAYKKLKRQQKNGAEK